MKLGSLQLRVMLYCASKPDARLTAAEIATRFRFKCRENVTTALRRAVDSGWLQRHNGSQRCEYGAGPQLLRVVKMEAS